MEISKEVKTKAAELKKEGIQPVYITIAGKEYLYRYLTRSEWRQYQGSLNEKMANAETDVQKSAISEMGLEDICSLGLLYPELDLEKIGAGVINTLADNILFESGFGGPDIEPQQL
jgi:hypothetical protein